MIENAAIVNDWHVVARSADLEEGNVQKVRLLGQDLVLWRNGGRTMVWKDLCLHRGARLSMGWVENGVLVCPYHGWQYDCTGQCVKMPAHPEQIPSPRAKAITYPIKERYGLVWVCLGDPECSPPNLPEWDDPEFRNVHSGPYHFNASPMRAMENFLDASHFPFVHDGVLGDHKQPDPIEPYEVFLSEEGLSTSEICVNQPYGDHRGQEVRVGYTYRCPRPFTAYFSKRVGNRGERFSSFCPMTPVEDTKCILWLITSSNYGLDVPPEMVRERNDIVFNQDKPVVESQRPELLPLDLSVELHVRADKLAIEYRKWLKALNVKTGALTGSAC